MSAVQFQILLIVGVSLYLLPAIVAVARRHPHQWAILGVDLCLGWTLVGWIGTLMWSRSSPTPRRKRSATSKHRGTVAVRRRQTSAWDDDVIANDPYKNWLDSGATMDAIDRRFAIRLVRSRKASRVEDERRRAA